MSFKNDRATMSSDKAPQEKAAQQDDSATKDEHAQPPQSLALRRGMAPLQVSLAAGTHQAAPRVTPSTTASSVMPFSFLPYGPYHPHMLSPMPHPSPEIPMSLELTLAIGRAALQQGLTRNDDALRDALARRGAVLPTPQPIETRNIPKQPGNQEGSVAGERKESASPESSAAVGEPKESVAKLPQPSTAFVEPKATGTSIPESSSVVDESAASVSLAKKQDSLIRKEDDDSKNAATTTKPTRTSPRKTRSKESPTEQASSPKKSPLSSSQRRKQRKDMPIVPGGGVWTVTSHSPPLRPKQKKQKRKK
jgi:hypothetical protein